MFTLLLYLILPISILQKKIYAQSENIPSFGWEYLYS